MATSKKTTSLVLDTKAIEEDFFEDTSLYALRFSEHAYHVIWLFNKYLNMQFALNQSYFTDNNFTFTQYKYIDEKNNLQHYIYTNRQQGSFLIRELRGFHYFWMVKGDTNRHAIMLDAIKTIKENTEIELIQTLDLETLDQRNNFLF